jgi:hypothetical protein
LEKAGLYQFAIPNAGFPKMEDLALRIVDWELEWAERQDVVVEVFLMKQIQAVRCLN